VERHHVRRGHTDHLQRRVAPHVAAADTGQVLRPGGKGATNKGGDTQTRSEHSEHSVSCLAVLLPCVRLMVALCVDQMASNPSMTAFHSTLMDTPEPSRCFSTYTRARQKQSEVRKQHVSNSAQTHNPHPQSLLSVSVTDVVDEVTRAWRLLQAHQRSRAQASTGSECCAVSPAKGAA